MSVSPVPRATLIERAFACHRCGGQTAVARGTRFNAHARPRPSVHCICPGGPVWIELLALPSGRRLQLVTAHRIWIQLGRPVTTLPFCADDTYVPISLPAWGAFLRRNWAALTDPSGSLPIRWPEEVSA